jgi:hypothetical protein
LAARSITSGIGIALLAAAAINAYLGATVAELAWSAAHGHSKAQADFAIAMHIAAVSLPLSALCLIGLIVAAVFRFASDGVLVPVLRPGLVCLAAANVLAPVLLWSALKWAAS